jgi:cytoskeletal protein CcmA (bactofilin family)
MERSGTRDPQGRDAVATIGGEVTVTGEVACAGDLQIDGTVNGEVRCGTLFLGESGKVEGTVQADRVRVSGRVEGTIIAGDLAVEAGAVIKGELLYARIKVSAGAVIQGSLQHRPQDGEGGEQPSGLKLVDSPAAAPQPRRVYID